MKRRTRGRAFGSVAACAALLALSACAGAAEGGEVASAGGDANPNAPGAGQDPLDEQAQALAFAECMRDNGVAMPDPGPGQEGLMQALGGHDQTGTGKEAFEEAFAACQALLPEFATHEDAQPDEEAMLALAACLRDEGLDVPDDLFTGGAMHDVPRDELMAAMEACRDVAAGVLGDH